MCFEKNIFIEFEKDNVESIRMALEKYTYLLNTDEAVKNQVFDVEFVKIVEGENVLLDRSDINKENPIFKELNMLCMDDNGDLSETLFFFHALSFSELKVDIINVAKAIVAYSRRHNDTWEMWYDDMSVFGIDVLYAIARVYPEYTYLTGAYIIPYWDDEHADYVFRYLTSLFKWNGFNDHILKTFCYTDNNQARLALMTNVIEDEGESYRWTREYFDLFEYFKENHNEYDKFKVMMKERFKEQSYLQYSENDYVDQPILEFYTTILQSHGKYMTYYDYESVEDFSAYFITDSIENEAYELLKEIESDLGMALAPGSDIDEDEDEDDDLFSSHHWDEFFKKGLPNGDDVWDYIIGKKDKAILDTIEPIDFLKYTKEHGLSIFNDFKYYLSEGDHFEEVFPQIFDFFISEYANEKEGLFDVYINGEEITNREMIFRAIDVLYRLNNYKVMPSALIENLMPYEFMDCDRLIDRIDKDVDPIKGMIQLCNNREYQTDETCKVDMIRIYKMISQSRKMTLEVLKNEHPNHLQASDFYNFSIYSDSLVIKAYLSNRLSIEMIPLEYVTYILFKDYQQGINDELTNYIMEYIETGWRNAVIDTFTTYNDHNEARGELLKAYLKPKSAPPREILMKMMTSGKDSLTEEERQILADCQQSVTLDEVYEKLETDLPYDDIRNGQKHYDLFNNRSISKVEAVLSMLFICSTYATVPSSNEMKKALELYLKLAPLKTLKSISGILAINNIESFNDFYIKEYGIDSYDFIQKLKRFGVEAEIILAWELTMKDEERLKSLYMDYVDDEPVNPNAMIKSENRDSIEKALSKVSEHSREAFYKHIFEMAPEALYEKSLEIFYDELPELLKSNVEYSKRETANIDEFVKSIKGYLENDISLEDTHYIKEYVPCIKFDYGSYIADHIFRLEKDRLNKVIQFLGQFEDKTLTSLYHDELMTLDSYVDLLVENDISKGHIHSLLLKQEDESIYQTYVNQFDFSDVVKTLSNDDKEKVLDMIAIDESSRLILEAIKEDAYKKNAERAKSLWLKL